jgi:hypothetical protein
MLGTNLMAIIGYARVSTDGQSLQSQTEALHLAGCGRIYSEKLSGAYADRPQLAKAIAALGEGDCLVVCKLDIEAHRGWLEEHTMEVIENSPELRKLYLKHSH